MSEHLPWHQRVRRWGQTNLSERDPLDYDADFWREHWRRTRVQGVIVNAGGIVAYYPSSFELQYRAHHLGERDLFGEVAAAARDETLAVLARMDSNRADERVYRQHPDWFACDAAGEPYQAQGRYITCINGPWYRQFLPGVLREIIERYKPEGFTDNSWSGLPRDRICYCTHCRTKFREDEGVELPAVVDWDDHSYRQWVRWSYRCRLELWDLNNATTQDAGGEHCLWLGMLNGNPIGQSRALRDLAAIGRRSRIIMCDHQSRDRVNGFEQNGLNGKLLHGVMGQPGQVPESMAMYVRGERPFRVASNPPGEARTWMIEGFAGGISPWWHHITARHEDRRQYRTAEPLMRWHEANEPYLYDRQPVAGVGVLWSHENIDFYGRDDAEQRVGLPFRGAAQALTRACIPYLPVHADAVDEHTDDLATLILPNLAVMTDEQVAGVRRFVERGGGLLATGRTSLLDAWGDRREDFALADVLGVHVADESGETVDPRDGSWEAYATHSYLRLKPELNQGSPVEQPAPQPDRHRVFAGFDETDLLPFGGELQRVRADARTQVLATYVPPFPIYPPEFCWTDAPRTDTPALVLREQGSAAGCVAYLPADIDRCYGRYQLPDHGDLLANLVRWTARDRMPLVVEGPGYLDCHLYRQGDRLILHVVNLTHARAWPAFVEQAVPVGPLEVSLAWDADRAVPTRALLRVAQTEQSVTLDEDHVRVHVPSVAAHELIVVE